MNYFMAKILLSLTKPSKYPERFIAFCIGYVIGIICWFCIDATFLAEPFWSWPWPANIFRG